MAERRMFAKTIIDSDAFLDMPLSTQSLYFHLSMRADDDGFINNPKKIQRMVGASDDDLKLLIAKRFIIPFESGIVVIKHWRIHNYIREDRRKDTVYQEEMSRLTTKDNGAYSLVDHVQTIECQSDPEETDRQKAYRESDLPYSFEYKIRQAFTGKKCPICGAVMARDYEDGIESNNRIPTIQHNKPISKGGKHELGNISVICHHCNVTLQDTETDDLNAAEVIQVWDDICRSNDGQVTDNCPHRIGQDRIDKESIEIENNMIIADDRPHGKLSLSLKSSDLENEFERVWSSYPRKQGKQNAFKSYIKARKTGTTEEQVLDGLNRYLEYIRIERIEPRYIKQGSTWFNQNCWKDDYTITRKPTTKDIAEKLDFSEFM